jgi:hypothetical protein
MRVRPNLAPVRLAPVEAVVAVGFREVPGRVVR